MSEIPSTAPAAPPALHPATPADQLLTVGIVLIGQNLHLPLNSAQLNSGAAAIVTLIGLGYGIVAANPSKISPLTWLLHALEGGSAVQKATWDAGVKALKAELLPEVEKIVDAKIHERAGLLAGPIDGLVNAGMTQAANAAAGALTIPVN